MPIIATCPKCRRSFRVKDEFAGRTARCLGCETPFVVESGPAPTGVTEFNRAVPTATPAPPKARASQPPRAANPSPAPKVRSSTADRVQEVLESFKGDPIRPRVTATYRIAIVLVAIGVVSIPIAYLASLAACAALLVWLTVDTLTNNPESLWRYFVIVGGATLVVFLVRPLFGRRWKFRELPSAPLEAEPALGALVAEIARRLDAPVPTMLRFDCSSNASAGLGASLREVLFGRKVILTLGLTLIADFSARQLAGVIAHELGHFSQGRAMRLRALIGWIEHWLARVGYQRDSMGLDRAFTRHAPWHRGIFFFTVIFVAMGRAMLIVALHLSRMVSAWLSRQMEYDADRCEAQIGGSKAFFRSMRRLEELGRGMREVDRALVACPHPLKLPDNFPALHLTCTRQVSIGHLDAMYERLANEETDLFASHPSFKDRIANIDRDKPTGVFRMKGPAAALVNDLERLCKAATLVFYYNQIGPDFTRLQLVPGQELFPWWDDQAPGAMPP